MLITPYLLFDYRFCTKPTDVPTIITIKLCPIEYNNKSSISHKRFPSLATIASITAKTSIAQGDEKKIPKIPAKTGPRIPHFVLLLIKWVDGIKLNISHI